MVRQMIDVYHPMRKGVSFTNVGIRINIGSRYGSEIHLLKLGHNYSLTLVIGKFFDTHNLAYSEGLLCMYMY